MFMRTLAAAAAIAVLAPISALAAPVNALGTYDLSNINYESLAPRGIWTGGSGLVTGNNASNLWDVEDSNGTFTINADNTASLFGVATNIRKDGTLNTDLTFEYNLQFSFVSDLVADPQAGYCQFGGSKHPCSTAPSNVDIADWDFFRLTSGTFSFLTPSMDVVYNITDRSGGTHKGQAGKNAMALTADDRNGFSMWFDAKLASGATSFSQAGYTFVNKNGDFNTYLSEVPRNIDPVPLPAAGWMLIAGVGGLAAAGRRKKA